MAVSQIHFRSISLPSRLHPINCNEFEAELQKLKSWQISTLTKTVPISSETIQSSLLGLAKLYSSIGELTQSPTTQQSLILQQHQDEKSVEESLNGSVELLDCCSSIRELVQMIRENVQSLQSALRRKGLDSENEIASYFCFRKKMSKCIAKSLKTIKNLENSKNNGSSSSNFSHSGGESFISVLREVSDLAIAIFKCILMFLSSSAAKPGGWNLVSRLMVTKSVASERDSSVISEVGCVDFVLKSLLQISVRKSDSKVLDMQIVQRSLQNLDSCVEGIEGGLERLFRQLLRSRVTLLNILTDH